MKLKKFLSTILPYLIVIAFCVTYYFFIESKFQNDESKFQNAIEELKLQQKKIIKSDSIKSLQEIQYRLKVDSVLTSYEDNYKTGRSESLKLKYTIGKLEEKFNHINNTVHPLPDF